MSELEPPTSPVLRRVQRLTRWRSPSPRWRGVIQLVAAAVFVVGIVVSLGQLELRPAEVTWWPIVVLALIGTPLTIGVNAAELRVMARCLDEDDRLGWLRAVRVVVLATAANVLPVPGGAMVRIQALTSSGSGVGRATSVNLVAALAWVAVSVGIAGVAVLSLAPVPGVLAVAGAAVGLVVSGLALRATMVRWSWGAAGALLAVEVGTTLLHGAKLYLVLVALGVPAGLDRALVLGVAGPVSAAAGVFPSGLGLAEVLSALLASLVAIAPAAGFSATAVVRIVGLAGTAPLALLLGVRGMTRDATGPATDTSDPATDLTGPATDHGVTEPPR